MSTKQIIIGISIFMLSNASVAYERYSQILCSDHLDFVSIKTIGMNASWSSDKGEMENLYLGNIAKECTINNKKYKITISYGDAKASGRCGASPLGNLTISLDGLEIINGAYNDSCGHADADPVIESVLIDPQSLVHVCGTVENTGKYKYTTRTEFCTSKGIGSSFSFENEYLEMKKYVDTLQK